jgi:general secretion pathway protein K
MSGRRPFREQRGIAVVTAMLMVAMATLLAVELVWELSLDLRRTEALLTREQAAQLALGAEALASEALAKDFEDDPNGTDDLTETWATEQAFPIDGGTVAGVVQDLQGRFNLNNLIDNRGRKDEIAVEQFRRVVTLAIAETDDQGLRAENIVDAVVDWLDPDQQPELGGAEDGVYTALSPPYRTGNFWFTSTTELLAVDGVTGQLYAALQPHVAALPPGAAGEPRRINVNTATPLVLQSLWRDVTPTIVEDWTANRDGAPYESVDEFMEGAQDVVDPAMRPYLDVGSSYFRLNVIVSIGSVRLAMYSLLERNGQGAVVARLRTFDTE